MPDLQAGLPAESQFRRVALEGEFDHEAQILLGPRSAPAGSGVGGNAPPGAANQSGWDVLTPLKCTDGTRVLVNRGWVPRESVAAVEQPKGRQKVQAVLKEGEKENKYATNDIANGRYIWLDLPTIAEVYDTAPLYVMAINEEGGGGGKRFPHERPLDSLMHFHVTPSTHLVYASTWGTLTVAGVIMTYIRFLK